MGNELRGNVTALKAVIPKPEQIATYGKRRDGSPKGPGFFGELRADDPNLFSTELSTEMTVDGKRVAFPLLVPTLTTEEIAHLVDGGTPTESIARKAYAHAQQRLAHGQSPFADFGEQLALPQSATDALREGFTQ